VGHLYKDFPLNARREQEKRIRPYRPKCPQVQENPPSSDEAMTLSVSVAAKKAPTKEAKKKRGKEPYQPPSPPLTRARATAKVAFSTSMFDSTSSSAYPSTSYFCIASSIYQVSAPFYQPPITLAYPLQPSSSTFSCTLPSFS